MASQTGFSVERLQRFGAEAVRKERRKQEIGHTVTLVLSSESRASLGPNFFKV